MSHFEKPLSPVTFLERSGRAFPEKLAVTQGELSFTFGQLLYRARCLAQGLSQLGVKSGDKVAVLHENSIYTAEVHFGIPGAGAIIVMINPWLSAEDIVELLKYSRAKVLIASEKTIEKLLSSHLADVMREIRIILTKQKEVGENNYLCYEQMLHDQNGELSLDGLLRSELDPIAINFTSGTTGRPKGVIYNHRAAYLHAMGQILMLDLKRRSNYLWTLPMFHVNGWGHIWAAVAVGATQFIPTGNILRGNSEGLLEEIRTLCISHLAGAPRLIKLLVDNKNSDTTLNGITILTGGTAPSADLNKQMEIAGVNLIHQYGLNETLGPFVVCEMGEDWKTLSLDERSKLRMRQGVSAIHAGTGLRVIDENGFDVPHDGRTIGEVVMFGNTLAMGYYDNPAATASSFRDGMFRSDDMAVVHPDGYLEIRDRKKDMIYVETEYGWENVSAIEIENIILQKESVQDAAVMSIPCEIDSEFNHIIVAFIEVKDGRDFNKEDIEIYCRENLAIYKWPKKYYFTKIPKTSTGKVQKNILSKLVCTTL
jgi:fatty-acyl-CoA synthase